MRRQPSLCFGAGLVVLSLGLSGVVPALATSRTADEAFYYEIGGARAAHAPHSYATSLRLGSSSRISSNLACGQFNLDNNLSSLFNNLNNQADRAVDAVLYAATSALSTLPLYLLRRADPNLANLMENALARYEQYIELSVRSCREAQQMVMQGENPYGDWVRLGTAQKWKAATDQAAGGQSVQATETHESVLEGEKLCVTWLGGEKRACEDGEPIDVIAEVVERGYELAGTAGTGEAEGALGEGDARLTTVFDSPDAAARWLVTVVGDMTIDNRPGAPPQGTPGHGLSSDLGQMSKAFEDALTEAVATADPDALADPALSVPGLEINRTLIEALSALPADARPHVIRRIATELSMLRAMEKINLARQLLLTGVRDPYIAHTPAYEAIHSVFLPQLDREYQLLISQYETQQRISTSTLARLVNRHRAERHRPPHTPAVGSGLDPVERGVIATEGGE